MFLLSDNAPMVFMDIGGDDTTSPQTKEVEEAFNELDTTLKDVMDTILDEAMAREVRTVSDCGVLFVPDHLSCLSSHISPLVPRLFTATTLQGKSV